MAVPYEQLQSLFAKVPKKTLEAVAQVAKSARVKKADEQATVDAALAGAGGLSEEDAQDAILAAGRMLAPFAEMLTPDVLTQLADAVGMKPAEDDEPDADDAVAMAKADDDGADDKDKPADSDGSQLSKADDSDGEGDEEDPVSKDDVAADMPDFADATDADKEAALAAARTAYAQAMKERNVGAQAKSEDGPGNTGKDAEDVPTTADDLAKSGVTKSALAGFSRAQRAALEPILKSQQSRLAEMERQHRAAIKKSADLAIELQRREYVAKAQSQYAALGNAEEIADNLMKLHQVDPQSVAAMEQILKAANAQAKAGGESHLFGEMGTRNPGVAGDADHQIKQEVASWVQKSAGAKSEAQAEAEFLSTPRGRLLYAQSRRDAEKRKG